MSSRRRIRVARLLGGLLFGLLAVGCGSVSTSLDTNVETPFPTEGPTGAPPYVAGEGVQLDEHTTLAPAPANAHPQLTSTQAWQRYALTSHLPSALPKGSAVHLGTYVGSGGDGLLSYGFQIPGCFSGTPGRLQTGCVEWVIVDANTGGPHGDYTYG